MEGSAVVRILRWTRETAPHVSGLAWRVWLWLVSPLTAVSCFRDTSEWSRRGHSVIRVAASRHPPEGRRGLLTVSDILLQRRPRCRNWWIILNIEKRQIVSASAVMSWFTICHWTESVTLRLTSCASYELVKSYRQASSQFAEDEPRPLSAANIRISGDKEMASKLELNVRFTRSHLVSWGCYLLNIRN